MQMPEMSGYEVASSLRKQGTKIPIVACTAHAMTGDEEKCLKAGCDEYLAKPIDAKKLFAIMKKLLS